jgi:hypothetical protein
LQRRWPDGHFEEIAGLRTRATPTNGSRKNFRLGLKTGRRRTLPLNALSAVLPLWRGGPLLNDGGDVGVAGRSTRKQLAKALRATLNGSLTEPRAVGRTWRGHHCSKKEPRRSGAVVSITSTAGPPLRTDNVDPGGSVPGSCRFRRLWLLNYFCIHRRPLIRAPCRHG